MSKRRLRFGVLLSTLDMPMQCSLFEGIYRYAKNYDINLVTYIGTHQTSYYWTRQKALTEGNLHFETCFESIYNSDLDGLIVFSGLLIQTVGFADFNRYIAGIPKNIPTVSLMYVMSGIPSVIVENSLGMYNSVNHLIRAALVFVPGLPHLNTEAFII